jgi:3-deoxy-alpha-D-manno-octulosonate 8-oxidase
LRHGYANCLVFNALENYYGKYVDQFKEMLGKHKITLETNKCKHLSTSSIERMISMTLLMERPLTNALGPDWKNIFTEDVIADIYSKI